MLERVRYGAEIAGKNKTGLKFEPAQSLGRAKGESVTAHHF